MFPHSERLIKTNEDRQVQSSLERQTRSTAWEQGWAAEHLPSTPQGPGSKPSAATNCFEAVSHQVAWAGFKLRGPHKGVSHQQTNFLFTKLFWPDPAVCESISLALNSALYHLDSSLTPAPHGPSELAPQEGTVS